MDVEITPHKLSGTVTAIPSKSYAQRILLAASLADSITDIKISALSDDITAAMDCIRSFGAKVIQNGNIIQVHPHENTIADIPCFNCNESGTVLRLTLPVACAFYDNSTFKGKGRLIQRPLSPLKEELAKNGSRILQISNSELSVCGKIKSGIYTLPGNVSSQFISGLLFALPLLDGDSKIIITSELQSKGYIDMTVDVLKKFGISVVFDNNAYFIKGSQKYISPHCIDVEGDWSNSAFWLCAGALGNDITVAGLEPLSIQGDSAVISILENMGAECNIDSHGIKVSNSKTLTGINIDLAQIPDLAPVLSAIATFADGKTLLYNAQRLRFKESDRIEAICDMLTSVGCTVQGDEDSIMINGKKVIPGGQANSHNDHRIAMTLAICATVAQKNITITNAEAVAKTYPDFFNDYIKLGGIVNVINN